MPINGEADEADEGYEADEMYEADEAARRWPPHPRPKLATGQNLFRPRPTAQYVTQAQLETALARVGSQIRTNSTAISQLGTRAAAATAAVKKETTDRRKDTEKIKNSLSQTQQLAAILPLLSQPKTLPYPPAASGGTDANLVGQTLLVDGSNTLNLLLPLLLLTSVGDGGAGGGGLFGGTGSDNTMMMLVLVLALSGSLLK